ncbi:conserved Plasmodium protein, unknown function [Plasmodium relictum]|uniref:DNA endonuclease activator Ctp1 C-terminal domain-containing protein n=1 Tax=Plasmodium relictum TaxID=85471 RepID=A0A1J1H351_PLARL|nr:conserved Plasmodium protein, unknown function [Plasmodium relictum]CRG99175.1 conserved Plasmodium protein, unknown function [Plasmodium relictum]
MNILTKNDTSTNNKEKRISVEIILESIFDELIYDFKKKFIEKMTVLINEIENDGLIMKIDENKNDNIIQEHEKNKKECKLYNESILGVYLKSFTDINKKSLLKKLQKEKNEDTDKIYKKINYKSDPNEKIKFFNSSKSESSNVSTQKKKIKNNGSCNIRNELISKLNNEINNELEKSIEDLHYSSSNSNDKYAYKNISINESIIELMNSNNIRNLNMLGSSNNKKENKYCTNINNNYNDKNIISTRFFSKNRKCFDYHKYGINSNYHKASNDKIIKNNEKGLDNNNEDEQIKKLKRNYNSKSLTSENNKINIKKKCETFDKICENKTENSNSKMFLYKLENYNLKDCLEDELKEKKKLNNCRQNELVSSKSGVKNKKINESKKYKHLFFEVIRGKRRKHLEGFECKDCKLFYNELYSENSESENFKKNKKTDEHIQNIGEKMKMVVNDDSLNEIVIKNNDKNKEYEEEIYNDSTNDDVKKNIQNNNILNRKHINSILYENDQTKYNYESNISFDNYKYTNNYSLDINKNYNLINEGIKEESNEKEKEKKKIIQSFSRHRYHSRINDSPKNFWNFDFFK